MSNQIRRIFALARLIILDGLRRHALIGLILFALAGIAGGLLFSDFIPREIGRATNDFFFSISWLTGLLFLLFHAVQVMAWDSESGGLHTYLARPISRAEYALGLYVGLAALLLAMNLILGGIGWALLAYIKGSIDTYYFPHLSLTFFFLAGFGLFWIELTILSVILFLSSVVRGGFPVLLLTLSYYLICSGLPVVRASFNQRLEIDSPLLQKILQSLTTIFPDFSRLDLKTLAATNDKPPSWIELSLPFALNGLYVVIVLWMACLIYQRRDLH